MKHRSNWMSALLDKVAFLAAIKGAEKNNLKKVQNAWDKKYLFNCIVYSLMQIISACTPVPMPKSVKGMFSIRTILILFLMMFSFHMFSLSAQTPRKDSGAEGLLSVSGTVISSSDGKPILGVSVQVQGEKGRASSKNDGYFSLKVSNPKGTVSFSHMGFRRLELPYVAGVSLNVKLIPIENQLDEVEVVSTGYQKIPKERATGSFELINNKILNKRVGGNILDRLENASVSLRIDKDYQFSDRSPYNATPPNNLLMRGRSAISGIFKQTVVLDNAIYEGDVRDINPNDIESVTILKDAVASSIWGTAGGGGVIVLTSKSGSYSQPRSVNFTSNLTIASKPDIYKLPFMSSTNFIDYERYLFDKGYYDYYLNDRNSYSTVSPVIELLGALRSGNAVQKDVDNAIENFKRYDVRDDYSNYFYRNSFLQQYNLDVSGGNQKITYLFSLGTDVNKNQNIASKNNRYTFRSSVKAKPIANLEINTDIRYTKVHARDQSILQTISYGASDANGSEWPYLKLVDDNGQPVDVDIVPIRKVYRDTAGNGKLLDWHFNPLKEIDANHQLANPKDLLINFSASYRLIDNLNLNLAYIYQNFQNPVEDWVGIDSYAARNMINFYSQWNDNSVLKRPIPIGDRMNYINDNTESHTLRFQGNYSWHSPNQLHRIQLLGGSEIRDKKYTRNANILYGYNRENLNHLPVDYTSVFPILNKGYGGSTIEDGVDLMLQQNRFVSFFANANYEFKEKYIVSGSLRQDASNIFGIGANNKWQPLWSAGVSWRMDKEWFEKNDHIDQLKLRFTYGFAGRANTSYSAYPIIYYNGADSYTNLPYGSLSSAPNPSLTWEKIQTMNLALDFGLFRNRISGTFEYYNKNSKDLITNVPIDPTMGYESVTKNGGELRGKGFELTMMSQNIRHGNFSWNNKLLLSKNRTKVARYPYKWSSPATYVTTSGSAGGFLREGFEEGAVFAFASAGLDPQNGDPRGYLNGEVSTDYNGILYGSLDNMKYVGPGRPVFYGSLENEFSIGNFSFAFNMQARWGHYMFRKSFFEMDFALNRVGHDDYLKRWQNPGDELTTVVPSLQYPLNSLRDEFYKKSEVLVIKGDNLRLQDLYLSYRLPKPVFCKSLALTAFAKNINWIIWKANKLNIDPEYRDAIPLPFTLSLGAKVEL
ncbi:SusC/RagA family TonB-linked outer membrane protein [Sphingobacterium siyangense]|uniref:SusC/RagA family TonB-linked outer membrane protein n=1 Tax=Sphingobacterium siyangense TaxID=459529 RepID=UPI0031F811EE